jgi:hypothetical protein
MKTCPLCTSPVVRIHPGGCDQKYCGSCIQSGAVTRARNVAYYKAHSTALRAASAEYARTHSVAVRRHKAHYNKTHPEVLRAGNLRRRYGLTQAGYASRLAAQGGACAICHNPPPTGKHLHVDHDHTSGKVRALLCRPCNLALGLLETSGVPLLGVVSYFLRHRQEAQYDLPPSKEK